MSLRELVFPLVLCLLSFLIFNGLEAQRDNALQERDQALYERDFLIRHANTMAERLAKATASDLKHTQELADARKKNLDRRRAVDAGDQRLFVKVACPAAVPADAGAGSVADARTPELSADARPDYFTLVDQLAVSRQMILGLQDHARLCQR
ncbi:lysis system i-spanin subunit Rz [Pseudomonas palmensis]